MESNPTSVITACRRGLVALLACGLTTRPWIARAQSSHQVTAEMVETWMTDLSNWGRWGDDDQHGTLNLITSEKRRQAVGLARTGTSVSLSHNYLKMLAVDATSPFVHKMLRLDSPDAFSSDRFGVAYHGFAHSHMDSLCHMMYQGRMYNGFIRDDEVTVAGCNRLAILNFKQGIVSLGIFVDMVRLKGVGHLEPGTPIYVQDLEA